MRGGYIKLYRSLLDWEWFLDGNTLQVFLSLLLTANHKDSRYRGDVIRRGEVVFGRKQLAETLGLSEQNIRTAINHLISTNEITIRSTKKYTVATIVKYSVFQDCGECANQETNQDTNQQLTNNQPTANQQLTTSKNIRRKEWKKEIPPSESSNELSSPQGEAAKVKKKPKSQATESFATFWKAYPKKVAKAEALKAWAKIEDVDAKLSDILAGLERAKRSQQWMKDDGQFIPYPATWLNQTRWEDEYGTTAQRSLPPGYELN